MTTDYIQYKTIYVKKFVFNDFFENTYVVWDDTGECVIIDPGCISPHEKDMLFNFINEKRLRVSRLLNTHCHIDHIFGNKFVYEEFGALPECHEKELDTLRYAGASATLWGIPYFEESPLPQHYLSDEEEVGFGNTYLRVIYAPGHTPGHIMFYHEDGVLFSGDVIFYRSVGRTDLPGGDYTTLMTSIREKVMTLPDDTIIHPGHGEDTTIGDEKLFNPFAGEWGVRAGS